jgi:orotidine-5'-phosphate decarboxylase
MNEISPRDRLIVALDRSDRTEILRLADAIGDSVGWLKVGLQAFVSNGPGIVRELKQRGPRIFLDLKFHDIPNTTGNAVSAAMAAGADMTNVHAAGGRMMLASAARAAGEKVILLGVTVLTSLGDDELEAVGFTGDARSNVVRLSRLCAESGIHGVVASPLEITAIRESCGDDFLIVTPGIRGIDDNADDQKRTLAPAEALARGADYIVVGRPITAAPDPRSTALRIVEQIS